MSAARWAIPATVVLAGPTALAFFSGGYFDEPRLVACIVAAVLVLAAAVLSPRPLPRHWPGRLTLAGLAGLCLWTIASLEWAPLGGPALDDVQRLALYVAALVAAAAWMDPSTSARWAEPALALGAFAVVGYGLSERLLPGSLDFDSSLTAGGRLEQPLTYWNAMGTVAALGLVLSTRLAGDRGRPRALRVAAAALVPALGAGIYLTLSRGALAALAAGLVALLLVAADRTQVRAAVLAAGVGLAAAVAAALLPEVGSVDDGDGASLQGAILLVALLVLSAAAAAGQSRLARSEPAAPAAPRPPVVATRAAAIALGLVAVAAAVVAVSIGEGERRGVGKEASRLRSVESSRYDYWAVALGSFAEQPLRGVGSAGFRVEWLRERDLPETVVDGHSLYIETAAELGLVGLALLAVFIAGLVASARRALRADRAAAVGPAAALAAFAVHAGLDWDWEMPAVTLYALVLAGVLIALGDRTASD